jgi:hypothetical protein
MKALVVDLVVGLAVAAVIVVLLLFTSFDSTFIYQRF